MTVGGERKWTYAEERVEGKQKKVAIRDRKGIEGSRMGESGSGDVQKRNRGEQKLVEEQ